jgi:alginate O-acetyltransferase complex protein AlgJ
MGKRSITNTFNVLMIAIFVTLLWLPNIDSVFNIAPRWTNTEHRALTKLPEWKWDWQSVRNFNNKFVKYFIDNFGFRSLLIRWNSLFKLRLLKVDQFPKVLVGRDDWLYLIKDDEGNNALDYYRAARPFAGNKDIERWVRPLVELNEYLRMRGVRLLVLFAPMKTRIYPEYIPAYLRPVREVTRLDQLMAYIKGNTDLDAIDLGQSILEGKKKHRVFFKHDVHWNGYGAFYAYRTIATRLGRYFNELPARTLGDYKVKEETFHGGDLASMLGLGDRFSEKNFILVPEFRRKARKLPDPYSVKSSRFTEIFETPGSGLPRAVVFHDSFFNFLKPFLAEDFSRMACFQSYGRVDLSVIRREKPNIVICELVESFVEKSPAYVTLLDVHQ